MGKDMKTAASIARKTIFVLLATLPVTAVADSGVYIGGSYGNASIDFGIDLPGIPSEFDEDDSAFKAFLGYRFDLPMMFLGVEGGYVDLGEPELSGATETLTIDSTGLNLWGIAGLEAGLADFFVKAGYIAWDADVTLTDNIGGSASDSADGSDLGYGIGIAFGIGPVEVRGELEKYEFDDADVTMLSIGFSYLFD